MFQLSSRAEDLRRETTDLTGKEADLLAQIERGRPEYKISTNEAKHWLDAVKKVRSDAEKFLIDFQPREGSSLQSSYQLGCRAERLLKDVRRLTAEIRDLPVLAQAPPDPVVYWSESLPAIGVENILSKICGKMEDEDSRIIGIYGMGGVGKTTLLKIINNNFLDKNSGRFDLVIRVIVSNNVRIDRIQEDIGIRLGYTRPGGDRGPELPRDPDCRRNTLSMALIHKQFLLLLDDLWESLNLDEIGIPVSGKGSKIVFTTRSTRVCQDMEAAKVKVECLDSASSWKLFCRSLGNAEDQLSASTRSLAQSVAEKCGGLPLALVTVGHAMADARTDCEWEMALETLKGAAAEVDGIKEVRNILKFSFDRYKDEGHKECLLYCSLFPQGPTVYIDDLIEYWIGEGFLETLNCPIRTARNRCQRAITALKAACLLDEGHETDISKTFVKLHDMVREMALWISDKDCKADEKTIFALDPSQMPECAEMSKKWTHATRISLMSNRIEELPEWPEWSNLRTLLLRGSSNLEQIPSGVFESVPLLTVLDLSRTNINRLPPEICSLVELRYLNLKGTPLELLPKEVGKLTNLRILNLDQLYKLKEIPKEAISSLSSLQSLTMHYGSYIWRGGWKDNGAEYEGREVCLKDLVGLEQLEELQLEVIVNSNEDLHGLLHCRRLCSVIRSLRLVHLESFLSSDLLKILGTTKDLRMLNIKSCLPHETSFTLDLRNLLIFPADHLTKLKTLQLWDVPVESVAWMDSSVFGKKAVKGAKFQNLQDLKIPNLREITLINMQNLKSICGQALSFPNLKVVHIENCPKLEKLPFELNGAACLENLTLNECTKILEIIALEEFEIAIRGHQNNSFFPRLRTIMLQNMQNLQSICKQPLLFPNLKEVYVINCQELEKLPFELNTASCLETLTLKKCNKMVEIIEVEELKMIIGKDTFLYSIREINLEDMKNLRSICKQPSLFPSLTEMGVINCPSLDKLPFELNSATCLETLVLKECNKMVEIVAVEASKMTTVHGQKVSIFSSLTTITLENMQNLKSICGQPLLFPSLKELFVIDCPELEKLPFELNSAACLENLILKECNKMVEIVAAEAPKMTTVHGQKVSIFSSLMTITLENMQNLKSICGQPLLFPSLKQIYVIDCPELETLPFELNSATCLETLFLKECMKMVEIVVVEASKMTTVHGQKDSIFSSLTTITLENMQNLKSICGQPLLFCSLKKMRVVNCPALEKLPLELSSATCLEILCLKECNKMVEIVAVEASKMTTVHGQKNSIFSSLTTITLENMQNLKSICGQPLLFPSLKEMCVIDCPELEKLPFELNSAACLENLILKECNKMVEIVDVEASRMTSVYSQKDYIFCSLTKIVLENMQNLKSICGQPLLFPSLKEMCVIDCPELEKLPFELNSATCLDILFLKECNKMVEIVTVEASKMTTLHGQKDSIFSSLTTITLENMQNLKSICGQPMIFPSLKIICVINCPELEKLPFELNTASCLQRLVLKKCNKMVEIIEVEELKMIIGKDTFLYSIREINLEDMKNLRSICKQPSLFPSLTEMRVINCPSLENLPFELNSATCLETLVLKECNKMVEIVSVKASKMTTVHGQKVSIFSSLMTITLENMQNLKSICGQPLLFPSLKQIYVIDCPELETLPFELNSATCLETLFLKECMKMVEIVVVEASKMTTVHGQKDSIFCSLTTIILINMQNLKSICGQPLLFSSLKKMRVVNCAALEKLPLELNSGTCLEILFLKECNKIVEIVAVEASKMTTVHGQKDSIFSSLMAINLENMKNLKSICRQPLLFPSLKEMFVIDCPELEKLPFELNSATCLEILCLKECNKMVEIVDVEASRMTSVYSQKDYIFCSLTKIVLENMQNLKSICGQPLLFPSLKEMCVIDCPELEKLPFELNSATCLEILFLKECNKMVEIVDVEASKMTSVYSQKDYIFCSLIKIVLENMQNLKSICGQPMIFPSLKIICVINCPELEKLPFELNTASCLQRLVLKKCNKMVEIIEVEELKMIIGKDTFLYSIREINLEDMKNLRSICKQPSLFPSLTEMRVINCPSLENLPFELNSATCLETLVLKECNKMVEIVSVKASKMTTVHGQKVSIFSSLMTITLENMQNLKSICGQPLLFPSLKQIYVIDCPELETLPFELNSATCLETLFLKECMKMVEIVVVEASKMTTVHGQKDSIFCSLTTIILINMQNLKSICGQPLLFSSLKKMRVVNCAALEKLPLELNSGTCLEILFLKECNKIVEIVAVEASKMTTVHGQKDSIFSSLMAINLENMKNLKSICRQPLLFPSLKEMFVIDCPELEKLPFELNSATCLEILCLKECNKMVEIVDIEASRMTSVYSQKDYIFCSLTKIVLENMQNLKSICGQPLLFPSLKEMCVIDCPELEKLPFELNSATCLEILFLKECNKMVEIVDVEASKMTSVYSQKDYIFCSLIKIVLENMQNLKSICGQPMIFPSLKIICVINCPELEKLPFELNTASCLQRLVLKKCNKMVEIIEVEELKMIIGKDTFLYSIREINLEDMKNLRSICKQPSLFPSLTEMRVINCPSLENLPFELNSATCLETLVLKECNKMVEIVSVKASKMTTVHGQKVSIFSSLMTITLENMQNLKSICGQPLLFPSLKQIYVIDCPELETLPFELNSATCLETLFLKECMKMVEIVVVEASKMTTVHGQKDSIFCNLTTIILINMQNLKSICGQPLLFSSLKKMRVVNCAALEKLPLELNSGTCLEILFLKECNKIVEIVAVEASKMTTVHGQKDSIFSSLTTITSENMQNLKSICGQPLLFSSLKKMRVVNCPTLEKLPLELNSATCLEILCLKECNKMVEIVAVEASKMTTVHGQKNSIFSSLTTITLENMQNLKSICGQPLLFPSLKEMCVIDCPELEKLPFELNSAACLENLILKECNKMVEIVAAEAPEMTNMHGQKEPIFCNLTTIMLQTMQNLKGICRQSLLFPSLKEMFVINCPELKKLPFELNSATCLEILFLKECNKMVEIVDVESSKMTSVYSQKDYIFCSLIKIVLENMQNLKSICGQPLLFPSLKKMCVIDCPELEKLPFELNSATCLEILFLKECNKMVEIVDVEASKMTSVYSQKDYIFCSLTKIVLENMQNLKSICGQPLLFPSLKELFVIDCPELEKLPFELNSAACLENLILKECNKMVEIVAAEAPEMTNVHGQKDSIFSSLTTIVLENMQNLKSICAQPMIFPSLKRIHVINCPELETLPFELNSVVCLDRLLLKECNKMVEIVAAEAPEMTNMHGQKEPIFCSLTTILLQSMQNLKSMCGQPMIFPSLKILCVINCPELEKLPFELNSVACLQRLVLKKCNKMVEILAAKALEMTNMHVQKDSIFSSLTTITLENMQNLKSICGQPLLFPSLEEMSVIDCPDLEKLPFELNSATCLETLFLKECNKMVEIVDVEASKMTTTHGQKDSIFSSLTAINLENMQNLKSICRQPLLFPSLKEMSVIDCPELEKLPFKLNSARCLEILFLKECNKMVEIVDVEASKMTSVYSQKVYIFCSLTKIVLENMQNLKSICGQPMIFPSLKILCVINCPELEKLPFELNSIACLQRLVLKKCNKMVEIVAAKALEMTNMHVQKDSIFSSLTTITLENMQNLKSICGQPLLFPSLEEMSVIDCPELEKLPFELNSATCLETLFLKECNKMVEIVDVKASKMTTMHGQRDSIFSSLTAINLENMQNLKSICGQPLLFPSLKNMDVTNCPELEKLPLELSSAACLEILIFQKCNKMVEIVAAEASKMTNILGQKDSSFCSLTMLVLENMQNLKSICGQPMLFPSLKEMYVIDCPELEKLPLELNSATCLETLFLKECNKMVEIVTIEASKMTTVHGQKDSIFSSLTTITLENMQNLKRICGQPLLFPSLKRFSVINCPELEKLPSEFNNATSLETLVL